MLNESDQQLIANLRGRINDQHEKALNVVDWLERHLGKSRQAQDEDAVKEWDKSLLRFRTTNRRTHHADQ